MRIDKILKCFVWYRRDQSKFGKATEGFMIFYIWKINSCMKAGLPIANKSLLTANTIAATG